MTEAAAGPNRAGRRRPKPEHLVVAIPARDEEETLAECLASVLAARAAVPVPTTVVLVLDSCTDGSGAIAASFPDVTVVERDHGNVGRARHDAVEFGLGLAGADPARTWIAFTDADSRVRRGWLRTQLAAAAVADAYVGAVVPRLEELDDPRRAAWFALHPPGATLGHVHGANLGVRASAYLSVGGMLPLAVGEDVDLVARLKAAGFRVDENERRPVLTSSRLHGRAPGGYAGYLRDLVP